MDSSAPHRPFWRTVLFFGIEWLGLLALIAVYGAWSVPDVNETQYVLKAKHFWQPDWLGNDFFLTTADTHVFFYTVIGWLTLFFSVETVAWIGRLLTWGLLAAGWQTLCWAMFPRRFLSWLSLSLFLMLLIYTHQAGEWVVGGLEAKGFAYAFVFFALAAFVSARWNLGLVLLGVASLWHILVGGWSLIACLPLWFFSRNRPGWYHLWPGGLVFVALAAVSAWPNLALTQDVPESIASEAHRLIVFERLPHHLSYLQIKEEFRLRWGLAWIVWLLLAITWRWRIPQGTATSQALLQVHGYVLGGVLLAFMGMLISASFPIGSETAAGWLRYYWFRLGDVVVPLGIALDLTIWSLWHLPKRGAFLGVVVLLAIALTALTYEVLQKQQQDRPRSFKLGDAERYDAWLEMTAWIRQHTPEEAVFLTPRAGQDFAWHAQRSTVVTWKDIPQNADALIEWWERLQAVHGKPRQDGFYSRLSRRDPEELIEIGRKYQAEYLLTRAAPELPFPVAFENEYFVLYRLPDKKE